MRAAAFITIGALITGGLVWVFLAAPAKAAIPVGWGLLGAIAGGVVGTVVGVSRYGIPDGSAVLIGTSEMLGAGYGWLLGSGIGLAIAHRATSVTGRQAWLLRALAATAIPIGVLTTHLQASLVIPGGFGQEVLPGLQKATLVDAVMVALVLVLAAGVVRNSSVDRVRHPGAVLLAKMGLVLGFLAGVVVFIIVLGMPQGATHRCQDGHSIARPQACPPPRR